VRGPPSLAPSKETHLCDTHQVEELLQLLIGIVDTELLKAVELKHLKPVGSRDLPEAAVGQSQPSHELQAQGWVLPRVPAGADGGCRPPATADAGPRSSRQPRRGELLLPINVQDANGGTVALQ